MTKGREREREARRGLRSLAHRRPALRRRLLRHAPMLSIVRELLGTDSVRMQNYKLNVKGASGGSAVEWHQDWAYYPHTNDSLHAVGVFIDGVAEETGALCVFPGTPEGAVLRVYTSPKPSGWYLCHMCHFDGKLMVTDFKRNRAIALQGL